MEQQELIDSGSAEIAQSLGLGLEPSPEEERLAEPSPDSPENPDVEEPAAEPSESEEFPVTEPMLEPPESWAKAHKDLWSKIPPEAQAYYVQREKQMLDGLNQYKEYHTVGKSLNDVLSPYRPMIQAAGLDEAKAVATLLNAHYRLTQGPVEQRMATYQQLGRDLGFVQPQQQPNMPPEIQHILREQQQIRAALMQRQQQEFEEVRTKTTREVEEFSKDKPYFDDCATEIVAFINAGHSLQDAYDRAVYANPVTRAKEQQRLRQETERALKDKAKGEVAAAKKATAANVRGRDTMRTPTEPLGKIEDTMRETLREIKSRAH